MPFLDTRQQRASLLIILLGIGLTLALWPFLTGLIGALVLYVMFAPLHRWLTERIPRGLASALVILLALLLVIGPGVWFVTILATEAEGVATGVAESSLLERVRALRIGPYDIGAQLEAVGSRIVAWLGSSALGLVGTVTRLTIQLTLTGFGLYYLLQAPGAAWAGLRPFIPFSRPNAEALRARFRDVTTSMLIGTFLTAVIQGMMIGIAFWVLDIPNPVLWGSVTVVLSILPVVGSGLVWGPAAAVLAIGGRWGAAVALLLVGAILVGNIDNVIRPWAARRYAQIHPFVTILGAFAGVRLFGLLGLLIGPLAISYFFELIRMYKAEYVEHEIADEPASLEASTPVGASTSG